MIFENSLFLVESNNSKYLSRPPGWSEDCPVSDEIYFVARGPEFNDRLVRAVARLANTKTREFSSLSFCKFRNRSALVAFSHALEHLVVIDLCSRLPIDRTKYHNVTVGRTATGTNLNGHEVVFFWVRDGIAQKMEVRTSVRNTIRQVVSNFR